MISTSLKREDKMVRIRWRVSTFAAVAISLLLATPSQTFAGSAGGVRIDSHEFQGQPTDLRTAIILEQVKIDAERQSIIDAQTSLIKTVLVVRAIVNAIEATAAGTLVGLGIVTGDVAAMKIGEVAFATYTKSLTKDFVEIAEEFGD